MLNISKHKINDRVDLKRFLSIENLENRKHHKYLNKIIVGFFVLTFIVILLPWTQNIQGEGFVTTLTPDQRPQTIHTTIPGRIEKWYVSEGQYVKKGDTILFLSEIKDDYFNPDLIANTENQVNAKKQSLKSYTGKINALNVQLQSLQNEQRLKQDQAKNKLIQAQLKVQSDSMDLAAARTELTIAKTQFDRSVSLNKEGLKPLTDVEDKRLKLQSAEAKIITQQNKYLDAKNELINARIEINRLQAEFAEKLAKAQSEQFTAMSNQFDAEGQVNKLENQYANYKIRNDFYYIRAPQDGFVNRALQSGLGETIKEGTPVVSIMPSKYDIAVETFVSPIDLPLIHPGEKVRIWFDGWPTIVFSGWPNLSYGTFGGKIVAIENYISSNGKYRVLIAQDPDEEPWPTQLSIGAGAQTLALLENVPIWFEIWRQLNGFPPNYYIPQNNTAK
jgi:multidrug resistance efflux pump